MADFSEAGLGMDGDGILSNRSNPILCGYLHLGFIKAGMRRCHAGGRGGR